jgi:uridylate kinase
MKTVVISLGGSIIIPDKVNISYLETFKKKLRKMYRTHKFVIVCGGGSIARKYIEALRRDGKSEYEQSQAGCRATRMNALLLMQIFGKEANDVLPMNIQEIENDLKKNNIVICGALRYATHSTSDGTAAKVAHHLKTDFINMTNIKGLYTANPKTNKNAKYIPNISWKDFESMALKIKYKSGQHFVLDQEAAVIIRKYRIPTYIISEDLNNLSKLLSSKKFIGTTIRG